ncbi:MAG: OmpH family outer membrane protein [Flavobacteriaceae bacterium]|nr:OmpH family outer membrane protein [Flavobacteriaceae bacterium]
MKKLIVLFALIMVSCMGMAQHSNGYYDHESVKESLPSFQRNKDAIEALKGKYNDSLLGMVSVLQSNVSHSTNIDYTPAELKRVQDSLQRLQQRIQSFQANALEAIDKKQRGLDAEVAVFIAKIIREYCESRNIAVLTRKSDLAYCRDCKDYTKDLIQFIESRL